MTATIKSEDNRLDARHSASFPLTFTLLSSKSQIPFEAIILNCSQDGLCLQSTVPLKQGQYICVRSGSRPEDATPDQEAPAPRSFSVAQVRWCVDQPAEGMPMYTIGIRYV